MCTFQQSLRTPTRILYKYILWVLWKVSTVCVFFCTSEVLHTWSWTGTHKRVSRSWLQSEAGINRSQCMELFSSFLSDSSSALPLVRAYFSSLLMCLLSRAKPEIQRRKETVLKPSVRPRYTILQAEESDAVKLRVPQAWSQHSVSSYFDKKKMRMCICKQHLYIHLKLCKLSCMDRRKKGYV